MAPIMRLFSHIVCSALCCLPVRAQQPLSDAQHLAAACNRFAADLHGELGAQPTCSPVSIALSLMMLVPGARGATAKELADTLHLPEDLRGGRLQAAAAELLVAADMMSTGSPSRPQRPPALLWSNNIWLQEGHRVSATYVDLLRQSFGAAQWHVDFAADADVARRAINSHIAKATHQRIEDLLAPGVIVPTTRVVLTNALWFKARWEHPFWEKHTLLSPFVLDAGTAVEVSMMRQTHRFLYAEDAAWHCLSMPFDGTSIRCEIILPRAGTSLRAAEAVLLSGKYVGALAGARVKVDLPRFEIAGAHRLKPVLAALGVKESFTGDADFSGICAGEPLVVDELVHQSWFTLDEDGAEAAAATATTLRAGSELPPDEIKVFTANRPFAFVLRDQRSGLILFVGRVTDPRSKPAKAQR